MCFKAALNYSDIAINKDTKTIDKKLTFPNFRFWKEKYIASEISKTII